MERDFHTGLNNADRIVLDEREVDLPLHPHESILAVGERDQNALEALENFAAFIAATHEADYGDWMRRANLYLEQLRLSLLTSVENRSLLERDLSELKKMIQYKPNWQVAETQRAVVAKVREMQRRLSVAPGSLH